MEGLDSRVGATFVMDTVEETNLITVKRYYQLFEVKEAFIAPHDLFFEYVER